MKDILISWIGKADLEASKEDDPTNLGPIAQAIHDLNFEKAEFFSNYPEKETDLYINWLRQKFTFLSINLSLANLSSPTNYAEIYAFVKEKVSGIKNAHKNPQITFHLSPGTPAMAAIWIILAKTHFTNINMIESSKKQGVKPVNFPFELSAEFIPDVLSKITLFDDATYDVQEFSEIIHKSPEMQRAIIKAKKASLFGTPVLIEGESGTGKELFAKAIHNSSNRKDKPFIVINCGAIPENLIESELFGHKKGAFTGAERDKKGYFEEAEGGTLFLDEIGELPKQAQVKILRAIQEKHIQKVGMTSYKECDIRIISATNRDLFKELELGNFREDLLYRLAVLVIKIPPLRERTGDISLLTDKLLEKIQSNLFGNANNKKIIKKISPNAKNILIQHNWRGNVRELINTLQRLVIFRQNETIDENDVQEALIMNARHSQENQNINIVKEPSKDLSEPHDIEKGINLKEILKNIAREYLESALVKAEGKKSRAAALLGFKNYQTFDNWMKRNL